MKIDKVIITLKTQEKIFKKHKIKRDQIENTFFDKPYCFKVKNKRYLLIGYIGEYITIVFNYKENQAYAITAYKSSKWQKKLYKRK